MWLFGCDSGGLEWVRREQCTCLCAVEGEHSDTEERTGRWALVCSVKLRVTFVCPDSVLMYECVHVCERDCALHSHPHSNACPCSFELMNMYEREYLGLWMYVLPFTSRLCYSSVWFTTQKKKEKKKEKNSQVRSAYERISSVQSSKLKALQPTSPPVCSLYRRTAAAAVTIPSNNLLFHQT